MFILISSWWAFIYPAQTGQHGKRREGGRAGGRERGSQSKVETKRRADNEEMGMKDHRVTHKLLRILQTISADCCFCAETCELSTNSWKKKRLNDWRIWNSLLWPSFDLRSISFSFIVGSRRLSVVNTFPLRSHYWFTFRQRAQLKELSFSISNAVVLVRAL